MGFMLIAVRLLKRLSDVDARWLFCRHGTRNECGHVPCLQMSPPEAPEVAAAAVTAQLETQEWNMQEIERIQEEQACPLSLLWLPWPILHASRALWCLVCLLPLTGSLRWLCNGMGFQTSVLPAGGRDGGGCGGGARSGLGPHCGRCCVSRRGRARSGPRAPGAALVLLRAPPGQLRAHVIWEIVCQGTFDVLRGAFLLMGPISGVALLVVCLP